MSTAAQQAETAGAEADPGAPSKEGEAAFHPCHPVKPLDSSAETEVAAIVLNVVAASAAELASNSGSLADAAATSPGHLLHQALVAVVGPERTAEPLPPPATLSGSSSAMSDSVPGQVDPGAEPAGEVSPPVAEISAAPSTTSPRESGGPHIVSLSTPEEIATIASKDATAPDAAASFDASSHSGATGPARGAPAATIHSTAKAIADIATPADSPEAPQLIAPSLFKPARPTPAGFESEATLPNADTAPAFQKGPTSILPAKADPQAMSLAADASENSGPNGDAGAYSEHSHDPISRFVLDLNSAPLGRLPASPSTAPTAPETPPSIAAAATANQLASTHSTPTTISSHIPSSAPIALADLPLAIALQTKNGKSRFAIRLDPPELGRIDVRIDIDSRSNVMLRLVAERPETLELMRRDAAHIERALQDAGLKTGDQALQFSLHDHSDGSDGAMPDSSQLLLVQDEAPAPTLPQIYARPAGSGAGIDIRV